MNNPRNQKEAIACILDTTAVDITIHCQVENFVDGCSELMEWRGEIGEVEELLPAAAKRRGWKYRHHPGKFGFQQWVCEQCAVRQKEGSEGEE